MLSILAIDLLSDSTGTDMVMMTIKNFDFLDNEIEEYDVSTRQILFFMHVHVFYLIVYSISPIQDRCANL